MVRPKVSTNIQTLKEHMQANVKYRPNVGWQNTKQCNDNETDDGRLA
jgi:hypothetical protein